MSAGLPVRISTALLGCLTLACSAAPVTPATPTPLASATPVATATASVTPPPTSLLPDGAWQVELTDAELVAAGARNGALPAGVYTWTFEGTRARLAIDQGGDVGYCSAEASPADGGVLFTYLMNLGCGGWTDTISWALEDDGLHLTLVDSTAPPEDIAPYLQAKPWQPVPAEPIPSWPTWSVRCEPGCHGPIVSTLFVSSGLLPGMSLAFGDEEWFNTRDDQDEIEFDLDETALRFWINPRAAMPNGEVDPSVPGTQEALTAWFVSNENLVVSEPQDMTLGDDITATTFAARISDEYVNADPACPQGVRSCLDMVWVGQDHVFGVGYGSVERFYLFTLADGDLMVVSLDAPDEETFAAVDPDVADLLSTLKIP
jgi:hypothetical protein